MAEKNENGETLKKLVKTLVSVIEGKDKYLKGHSEQVAKGCVRFSKHLGLPQEDIEGVYLAGLLHDIGMVYIPLEITQKKGKLDENEMLVVKQHPIISEKILSKHKSLSSILKIIRYHHESFDGTGYPEGLKGDEISLETYILSIVNCYEAMVSARSHRPSLSSEKALEIIGRNAGLQFDDSLVSEFLEFMQSSSPPVQEAQGTNGDQDSVKDVIIKIVRKAQSGEIDLPVLPKVVQEIQQVMNQPNSTVDDVAKLVERDGVISVKLISVANSPMYRGAEKIIFVRQAIPRLGVKETQSFVTAIANKSLYETKNESFRTLMQKLWLHSLACAYASRLIAKDLRLPDIEKLFLMGLIHDIGKPPLIKILTEKISQSESLTVEGVLPSIQEVHTSFGSALLKRWGFTKDFNRVASRHEGSTFTSSTEAEIIIVSLANKLVNQIGYGIAENGDINLSKLESAKRLDIDPETIQEICDETKNLMKETAHIF